jgi:hypothetical protein
VGADGEQLSLTRHCSRRSSSNSGSELYGLPCAATAI